MTSAAAGLAQIWLSREPSHNLAEPCEIFGAGFISCTRLDGLASQEKAGTVLNSRIVIKH